jgi:hypothetical protein
MSFGFFGLLVVVGSSIWVGFDARGRDWPEKGIVGPRSVTGWVVGCLLLWIVVFPFYLTRRNLARRRTPR